MKRKKNRINNLVIISDTHCGCNVGLCPPGPILLDDGGSYSPSKLQMDIWKLWKEFWNKWIPRVTKNEPFAVIHNGDLIDGVHHNTTTQISHNLADQARIAKTIMEEILNNPLCEFYFQIRGTTSHTGPSGVEEERIAEELGAKQDNVGRYARHELWIEVGKGLCNIKHHIGTTRSANYESTAPHVEMITAFTESGRWGDKPPSFVIRSHRHRHIETRIPAELGDAVSIVTAGWQSRTPFVYRTSSGRPQVGGVLIRQGDEDCYSRHMVWPIKSERDCVEII
jgi:hypothetical protein